MPMIRVGYNVPELPLPKTMPEWAEVQTRSTQAGMDRIFKQSLDRFYDQADNWITTQSLIRAGSPEPRGNYQPAKFPLSIPLRQICDYDADGNMAPYWADADPGIKLPQLPDWVVPAPTTGGNGPFGPSGGIATMPSNQDLMNVLHQILDQLARRSISTFQPQ